MRKEHSYFKDFIFVVQPGLDNPMLLGHGPGPANRQCKSCMHYFGAYKSCGLRRTSKEACIAKRQMLPGWPACALFEPRGSFPQPRIRISDKSDKVIKRWVHGVEPGANGWFVGVVFWEKKLITVWSNNMEDWEAVRTDKMWTSLQEEATGLSFQRIQEPRP